MTDKYTSTDSSQAASFGDAARAATKRVDEARPAVAERLERAASAIEDRAERIPGGQRVKEFTAAAADGLSTTADYVRSHDARRMVSDVEAVVRNNPGPALLVAAVLGFIVGRAVVRN